MMRIALSFFCHPIFLKLILSRSHRIFRFDYRPAHRNAREPRRQHLPNIFSCYAADGKGRQADLRGHSSQQFDAGKMFELLRAARKRRPRADVVRPVQHCLPRLLDRMRRNADEHVRPDNRPRPSPKALLPDVYAIRPDQRRHVRPIVDH